MPGADDLETDGKKKTGKQGGEGDGAGADDAADDAAGSAEDDASDAGDFADPVKALAEIKKLRAENAKHRTKSKSLEGELGKVKGTVTKLKSALGVGDDGDEEEPEKQIQALQQQNEALQIQNAMSELCREHEIPRKGEKYFNFLIAQEFEALKEGAEIPEERILEIAKEAKQMFAGGGGQGGGTGVGTGKKPPAGGADSISAAQFAKMNPGEKSALYVKDPGTYQKLFNEAKEKRLF